MPETNLPIADDLAKAMRDTRMNMPKEKGKAFLGTSHGFDAIAIVEDASKTICIILHGANTPHNGICVSPETAQEIARHLLMLAESVLNKQHE